MSFSPPRLGLPRLGLLIAFLVGMIACAPAYQVPVAPAPEQIPELESRVAAAPTHLPSLVSLGAAYREAGRMDEAERVLERAVAQDPAHGPATLFLGLVLEDGERWAEARARYRALLDRSGGTADLRRDLERRMPLLERRELQWATRAALAREAELADVPPQAGTVAVFPFEYLGADPQYAPLGRAMSEMLVTDLGRTGRLTVLERLRVQVLLDEMALAEEGFVDAATAARTGRIMGAARIVQGQVVGEATTLGVRAAVLPAPAGDPATIPDVSDSDELERFFDLQARFALAVYAAMGIQLTVAEEGLLMDRPTRNLQALLAWGRGLEAEDRGDYALAVQSYQEAIGFDADFEEPQTGVDRAEGMADSEQVSTADLTGRAWEEVATAPPGAPDAADPSAFDQLETMVPASLDRDAVVELLGSEGVGAGTRTLLEIIIRRP